MGLPIERGEAKDPESGERMATVEKHLQQTRETKPAQEEQQGFERQDTARTASLSALETALKHEGVELTELPPDYIKELAERVGNSAAAELLAQGRGIATTNFLWRESEVQSPVNEINTVGAIPTCQFERAGGEGANIVASSPRAIRDYSDGFGLAGGTGGMDGTIPSG